MFKIDIKSPHWAAALEQYRIKGDIRPLSKLVRNEDIPKNYKDNIADILEGDFKKLNGNSEFVKSYDMKNAYLALVQKNKVERLTHDLFQPFNNSFLAYSLGYIKNPPKLHTDSKEINKQLGDKFYGGDAESARTTISRKIRVYKWPKVE